jgi:four helix bundle protein
LTTTLPVRWRRRSRRGIFREAGKLESWKAGKLEGWKAGRREGGKAGRREVGVDFEKLEVWKISADLSVAVYLGMRDLRDFGFKDQITRSSLSIPSNIAEGMSRRGDREKLQFLNIAKGSCSELRTQIYIGIRIGYINNEIGQEWVEQTKRIAAMLSGLMKKLKQENC